MEPSINTRVVVVSKDGRWLVGGSEDRRVKNWDQERASRVDHDEMSQTAPRWWRCRQTR